MSTQPLFISAMISPSTGLLFSLISHLVLHIQYRVKLCLAGAVAIGLSPLIRFADFSAAADLSNSSDCFEFGFGTRFAVA